VSACLPEPRCGGPALFQISNTGRLRAGGDDADENGGGNQAFSFIGDAAFTGAAGELRAARVGGDGNDWLIEADTDGDGDADVEIRVTTDSPADFTAGDFLL
jgi:hypothetical protein